MNLQRNPWPGLALSLAIYLLVALLPWHADATVRRAAALVLGTLVLWIGELAPLGVIALLVPVSATLTGLMTWKDAVAAWGDPIIFLFLGAFLLARGLEKYGAFDGLLASGAIRRIADRPPLLCLAILLLAGAITTFQNNTAVTAMLLPVIVPLARRAKHPAGVLLALAYGATFGGLATPVGTAPNFLGFAAIKKLDDEFTFLSWTLVGLPAWLGATLIGWGALLLAGRFVRGAPHMPARASPSVRVDEARFVADALAALPALTPDDRRSGQRWAVSAFALTALLWLMPGFLLSLSDNPNQPLPAALRMILPAAAVDGMRGAGWIDDSDTLRAALERYLPESLPPILAAALLFLVRTRGGGRAILERSDLQGIDWDTLFLIAGGLCLGRMLEASGAAEALAQQIARLDAPPLVLMLAVGAATVLLSETTSNTATAALLVPVAGRLAEHVGIPPVQMIQLVALCASLGFALPISTPPNALVYGTGLIPLRQMAGVGLLVDGLALLWVVLCVSWLGAPAT